MSFQVELAVTDPIHVSTSAIGLGAGITKLAALSDGMVFEPVSSLKKNQDKLVRLRCRLARVVKLSADQKKQKAKISHFHSHIANICRDYLHKTMMTISKNHAMIAIKGLEVSNVSKLVAGMIDRPRCNVTAKSGLNRVILNQGWAEMRH